MSLSPHRLAYLWLISLGRWAVEMAQVCAKWGIETGLHRRRDVTLNEDDTHIRHKVPEAEAVTAAA